MARLPSAHISRFIALIALFLALLAAVRSPETAVVLILVGVPILVALGIYLAWRRRRLSRPCPRCGERVRNGRLACSSCRFDFRTIG